MSKPERPRVYLEEDCPVREIGIECMRERSTGQQPPDKRLHVWWARRPLTVSRASILGSILPADYPREDFLQHLGIPKNADPVGARRKLDEVAAGIRKDRIQNPYGYGRAFTHNLSAKEVEQLRAASTSIWGTTRPTILDSFAGGGSIPLEAYRLGLDVVLSELNPVGHIVQRGTIEYPARFGPKLAKEIESWGNRIADAVEEELRDCFPRNPGEKDLCYIWVRTVTCGQCELDVPLSPNWWLDKGNKLGYQLELPPLKTGTRCAFRIRHASTSFDPQAATVARGVGTCPRCATVLDGDEIKTAAREGRMGHQLAAIGFKIDGKTGRFFREATPRDDEGVALAEQMLETKLPLWEARGLVPNEERYVGPADRSALYGVTTMRRMFTPRQLLVHLATLDAILRQPWNEIQDPKRREALRVYAYMGLAKQLNYNSEQSNWHPLRVVVANTFDRHDFSFKWSTAEIDGAGQLQRWTLSQVSDAYGGIANLCLGAAGTLAFHVADAAQLSLDDKSVAAISIDPPYYDNVMYAELADFFYVWMKRALGDVFPELFGSELTDKDAEAVANVARFKTAARGKARKLADDDYTAKMLSAFRECRRVLRDDGVLTITFTHKRVDAWDSLGRALVDAGFEVTATWPVHTESEHSLHQAKKNAAASTILLVCRKRDPAAGSAWWEDLQVEVRAHVRERAEKFVSMGLRGQDTSIASFGPALQVISRQWPVKRKDGSVISPDEALDIAREEVMTWMFERIAEGHAKAVDKWTRFYILAWFVFGAREFPYDEARKLGLSVKVDIEKELIPRRLIEKRGNNVRLLTPAERFKKGGLDPTKKDYAWDVDYVHAAIHAYETGMGAELVRFHQRTEALRRDGYKHAAGYLLDVLPRVKEVTEYHTLDKLWEGNLQDEVKRRKPRTTDPTFEKQQRLDVGPDEGDELDTSEGVDDVESE